MSDTIYPILIVMAVEVLLSAVMLSSIIVVTSIGISYNERQNENMSIATEMQAQRTAIFYNATHVYQQDIVSLILQYKGDRKVLVALTDGSHYEWSRTVHASTYKVSDISALMPRDALYDADLIYGPNHYEIVGYQFVQCDGTCGR